MNESIQSLLAGFPVVYRVAVQWGDEDSMGHVNNVVHFRWFESARVLYGEKVGMWDLLAGRRIGPILASMTCHYRRQLKYPDTVHVGARILRFGRTSMVMQHRLVSESQAVVAAEADSTIVMFDYAAQKPFPVPSELREAVAKIEGRAFA